MRFAVAVAVAFRCRWCCHCCFCCSCVDVADVADVAVAVAFSVAAAAAAAVVVVVPVGAAVSRDMIVAFGFGDAFFPTQCLNHGSCTHAREFFL